MAMTENHEEVQKELGELRERAERLAETESRAAQMEEFLLGLQEERNGLAERLTTAEGQVATLGALLGRAQAGGSAEEAQRALEEARAEHARETEALRVAVARRDEELARVQSAMSTLRHAHEARAAAAPRPDEHDAAPAAAAAAAAAAASTVVAAAAATTAAAEPDKGAPAAAAEEGAAAAGAWEAVSENLGPELVRLNTARMEAAKERQSFADKKAFKVCCSLSCVWLSVSERLCRIPRPLPRLRRAGCLEWRRAARAGPQCWACARWCALRVRPPPLR